MATGILMLNIVTHNSGDFNVMLLLSRGKQISFLLARQSQFNG